MSIQKALGRLVHVWLRLAWVSGLALGPLLLPVPPPAAAYTVNDTVGVGTNPYAVAVNPVTNKIYIVNSGSNDVTVIDGADHSTTDVDVGDSPCAVGVNPLTNKIYVANFGSNAVTVIDGSNDSVSTTVTVGDQPGAVVVNPVTDRIYVANYGSDDLTIIDGSDDTVVTTVVGTSGAFDVEVNPVTDKIYVANWVGHNVTVIDGTNNNTTSVDAGTYPAAVAINRVTNKVYVCNLNTDQVTVITPARQEVIPLTTEITPLAGDVTVLPRPTFSFDASSTFDPITPPVRHIYYQVDTWTGPWLTASLAGAAGSGQTPALLPGTHLLFALAVDGQEATFINTGQGSSPVIGEISGYHFLMNGTDQLFLPLILKSY